MYLKRKIDEYLLEWKQKPDKNPLIIKGARQIGKTESINHFAEINYDKDENINGKHNEDLKEKNQTLTPKKVPTTPRTPKQPETPTVPSGYQESSPTVKTFPQTGEKNSNVLLFIGFTLIFATAGYYFWNRRN